MLSKHQLTHPTTAGSQNDTPELCDITYPLLPLSKGVIPCITSLLNPLKIISAADKIFKPQPILPEYSAESRDATSCDVTSRDETRGDDIGDQDTRTESENLNTVKDGEGTLGEGASASSRVSTKYDPGPPPMDMIGGEMTESRGNDRGRE